MSSTIILINTINTINNNYSYVNIGANNANRKHSKDYIPREFTLCLQQLRQKSSTNAPSAPSL
jgi:hypothetical protein